MTDLARLIEVGQSRSILLVLSAYFDESGHSANSRIVSMAGWLAPPNIWGSFSVDWKSVLDDPEFRVSVFHMNDFENQWGEFKSGWNDKNKRYRFLEKLVEVIKGHDLCGIGSVILMSEYEASRELREERTNDAYFLNFQLCSSDSVQIVARKFNAERVSFVFATQQEYVGRLPALYQKVQSWSNTKRFGPIAYDTPQKMIPLQAADLIAYETFKFFKNGIYDPAIPKRWPYIQLEPLVLGTTFVSQSKHDIHFGENSIVISR
jgi:hypothetical protein